MKKLLLALSLCFSTINGQLSMKPSGFENSKLGSLYDKQIDFMREQLRKIDYNCDVDKHKFIDKKISEFRATILPRVELIFKMLERHFKANGCRTELDLDENVTKRCDHLFATGKFQKEIALINQWRNSVNEKLK